MSISFQAGSLPVLLSFPHSGIGLPASLRERFTDAGRDMPDAELHLGRLLEPGYQLGCSSITPIFSRYLIDADRSTDAAATGHDQPSHLCPLYCRDGRAIYLTGQEPDVFEVGQRTAEFWQPYHDQIQEELNRLKHQHGLAVLVDVHSIPDERAKLDAAVVVSLNDEYAAASLIEELESCQVFSSGARLADRSTNPGFTPGIYGKPANRVHAMRLTVIQSGYLDESARNWHDVAATQTQKHVLRLVESILGWTRKQIAN